jgi:hypothetical protein
VYQPAINQSINSSILHVYESPHHIKICSIVWDPKSVMVSHDIAAVCVLPKDTRQASPNLALARSYNVLRRITTSLHASCLSNMFCCICEDMGEGWGRKSPGRREGREGREENEEGSHLLKGTQCRCETTCTLLSPGMQHSMRRVQRITPFPQIPAATISYYHPHHTSITFSWPLTCSRGATDWQTESDSAR